MTKHGDKIDPIEHFGFDPGKILVTESWTTKAAQEIFDAHDRTPTEHHSVHQLASIIAAHAEPRIVNERWLQEEFDGCRKVVGVYCKFNPPQGTGQRVHETVALIVSEHLKLSKRVEPLIALLRESKQEHQRDCDTRYGAAVPCTCGASAWNAKVDEVLSK